MSKDQPANVEQTQRNRTWTIKSCLGGNHVVRDHQGEWVGRWTTPPHTKWKDEPCSLTGQGAWRIHTPWNEITGISRGLVAVIILLWSQQQWGVGITGTRAHTHTPSASSPKHLPPWTHSLSNNRVHVLGLQMQFKSKSLETPTSLHHCLPTWLLLPPSA